MEAVTGIVLAGGRSQRMGRDKAALPFGNLPLVAWIVARVGAVCHPVMVVAKDATAYRECGVTVVADRWPGEGPLVGLYTGLSAIATEYAVAVACDLPFVEPAVLTGLIGLSSGWSAVVPEALGNVHPLCAVYHRSVAQQAEDLLRRGGGSLRRLLSQPTLRVRMVSEGELRAWDPTCHSFTNLNTPEEYEKALAAMHGAPVSGQEGSSAPRHTETR